MKRRAPKTRKLMSEIAIQLAAKGTSPSEILAEFCRQHWGEIAEEQDQIIEIGLRRLAGDSTRPRMGMGDSEQIELFDNLKLPPTVNVWSSVDGREKKIVRQLSDLTVEALRYHLDVERRRNGSRTKKPINLEMLLDKMLANGADAATTVGKYQRPQ